MFHRFFTKYARAVSEETERKSLYRLYRAKMVVSLVFYVLCLAIIAEAIAFEDTMSTGESNIPFVVFGLTLLLWLIFAIAALTLWLVFRSAYCRILNRVPTETEMSEVASYRQKTRAADKSLVKSLRWAIAVLVVGVICLFGGGILDIVLHPDSEDLTGIGMAGIGLFTVSFLIFSLALVVVQTRRSAEGKTAEQQTEEESKAIDAAQGRKHKYSLQEDNNAQTYRYLFPNVKLYAQAEALKRKQLNAALLSILLSCSVGIVIALIFFSGIVFDWKLVGFAFPVFMTIAFFGALFAIFPFTRRQRHWKSNRNKNWKVYVP